MRRNTLTTNRHEQTRTAANKFFDRIFKTVRGGSCLFVVLFCSSISFADTLTIPSGASDSEACGLIEKEHALGLDIWRANNLAGAMARFQACEAALKERSLWMPPKLPSKHTADQRRALAITNEVIFSLAAIYQRLDYRLEAERYVAEARRRGLLPKVSVAGSKTGK